MPNETLLKQVSDTVELLGLIQFACTDILLPIDELQRHPQNE